MFFLHHHFLQATFFELFLTLLQFLEGQLREEFRWGVFAGFRRVVVWPRDVLLAQLLEADAWEDFFCGDSEDRGLFGMRDLDALAADAGVAVQACE
jgi:hypothetical protein